MQYQPPANPEDADPVEELLQSAGLRGLVDVFDDFGWDDVEMIKMHFDTCDGVLDRLERSGHRLTKEQQQALRERLGLVSVEVADLWKKMVVDLDYNSPLVQFLGARNFEAKVVAAIERYGIDLETFKVRRGRSV